MAGNVWECCGDWYGSAYYAQSISEDPPGPAQGDSRVLRGGSWGSGRSGCRSAVRGAQVPTYRDGYDGFRCVIRPASS